MADTRPVVIGKFAYGKVDKDLKEERVGVYAHIRPPCGAWKRLGTAVTTDGDHATVRGVEDDGGRVFFRLPEALPVGRTPLTYLVLGDHSEAHANVYVVQPRTQVVVFDIDGTLTVGDSEISEQVWKKLSDESYVPRMWADAPQVARLYRDQGYLIVYVTGRPDNLKRITVEWLKKKGFPPGPLRMTDSLRQARPSENGVGKFKADHLRRLSRDLGLPIVAAYGNAETDVTAYAAAGVPKAQTYIIGKNKGHEGTVALDSYTVHLPELSKSLPRATHAAPGIYSW